MVQIVLVKTCILILTNLRILSKADKFLVKNRFFIKTTY